MKNTALLKSRNSTLDIIRIVATLCVISVHFFLNTNFYSVPINNVRMFLLCTMRTFFSVCVPLFLILTGYLMCNKKWSKSYYSGIIKTLLVYIFSSLACIVFRVTYLEQPYTFKKILFSLLDFTGAEYAWYIAMYIGLFLIIPFLNLIYNNIQTKRQKQILLLTLFCMTTLPTLLNIHNFETAAWWLNPTSTKTTTTIYPDNWSSMYPITYYFIGVYFREFGMKIKTRTLAITLVVATFAFSAFNYYRCGGGAYKSGVFGYWRGFEALILSSLFFQLLSRIKTDKYPEKVKWCLWKLSDLTLGIYLLSFIFDKLLYKPLNTNVISMVDKLPYFPLMVLSVFTLSAIASYLITLLLRLSTFATKEIYALIIVIKNKSKKLLLQDYLFILLIIGGLILSFWKCVYGFGGNDEAFYLTIPHRLSLGDALIKDEWHLSQLSGVLLLPFVSLYNLIFRSTEGIILAARIMYVIFHAAVSVFIYIRLRKYGYMSVFACVLYYIYTPYNIMAYSYNTMALDLLALTGTILGTISYKKPIPIILSGIAFACAVLCCPYLAIGYLLFGIFVALHYIVRKFIFSLEMFSIKTFLYFTSGVAAIAILFLVFLLSRVSISEIFEYLPHMMTDPEHPQKSYFAEFLNYFLSIFNFNKYFKIPLISYAVMLLVMIFDKKRKLHRSLYLIGTAAVVIFCYIIIAPDISTKYYNAMMFPLIFVGITSYILINNKPRALLAGLFSLGILHSIGLTYSSNQYFYVIAMAISVSNIASLIFLGILLKEMKETDDNLDYAKFLKYSSLVLVILMLIIQGSLQLTAKTKHCFWEVSDTKAMTSKITCGPAKGIYTTTEKSYTYTTIYSDLSSYYKGKPDDKILFLTDKTWCYLAANGKEYATLSAWLPEDKPKSSIQRLETYYKINPDKLPKYIYIPKKSSWDLTNAKKIALSKGYNVLENSISFKLEKIN